jgi:peptidoglycan/xylan/chitin deacetylase (PgdA/CDA1 family)
LRGSVLFLAAAVFLMTSAAAATDTARVSVLCYHTFAGKDEPDDLPPQEFAAQLDSLRALGYRFITFDEFAADSLRGSRHVLVTIDDGHVSVRAVYDSVLKPRGIQPVLFVYPGIIGTRHFALTWEDLAYLRDSGCTIGSHGYFHEYVDDQHYQLDSSRVLREIDTSRQVLEKRLAIEVTAFSYPFGLVSPVTAALTRRAGYRYGFTIVGKPVDLPLAKAPRRYELPRFFVNKESWVWIYPVFKRNAAAWQHVNQP